MEHYKSSYLEFIFQNLDPYEVENMTRITIKQAIIVASICTSYFWIDVLYHTINFSFSFYGQGQISGYMELIILVMVCD